MAALFNNLLINMNSVRYQPFLINLISGRRKLLSGSEFILVKSMLKKDTNKFNEYEHSLFCAFRAEKQFVTKEDRITIEKKMCEGGYFENSDTYTNDYSFSVEITRNCNINCVYCYVHKRRNPSMSMTKFHIDRIYDFYSKYADDKNKIYNTPFIRVTGGEPLVNHKVVSVMNYLSRKWPNSKMRMITNGVNLLKYYNYLPTDKLDSVSVSVDGKQDAHRKRQLQSSLFNTDVHDDIMKGIKLLLDNGINVTLSSKVDKSNYREYPEFVNFLKNEGFFAYANFRMEAGIVNDFSNPLDINDNFNSLADIYKINDFFVDTGCQVRIVLSSLVKLYQAIYRKQNTPFLPKHHICSVKILSKFYFACDGNVYFCDSPDEDKSAIGSYLGESSLDIEAARKLLSRNVVLHEKCRHCIYKFVCLGGCPMSARIKSEEMTCGAFSCEEILDNLEFDISWN